MATISITSADAIESIGSGFGGLVTFTVTLSEVPADTVTVQYRTIGGSADESIDFPKTSGTITFAPGEDTQTVEFRVRHDTLDETDEAFVLELFNPAGASFAGRSAVLRQSAFVLDDDGAGLDRAVFVSSPVVVEGNGGTQKADFTIRLSEPAASSLTLDYRTKNGSAIAGEDYLAKSGSVTFQTGQLEKTVRVDLTGDTALEPSEFFHLIVGPDASLGGTASGLSGTATILDNDGGSGLPVLSLTSANAVESIGSGFGGTVVFTLMLSRPAEDAVEVNYRSMAGAADEDIDYPGFDGTVTFAPGETLKTIEVRVNHDSLIETDEDFGIQLFDPTGAAFAGGAKVLHASAFILDDDGTNLDRALTVSSPIVLENNSGTRSVLFEVQLSDPAATQLMFDYATRDGSATAGEDYTAASGKLRFAPGQTKTVVEVELTGDKTVEPSEFFHLSVSPGNGLGTSANGLTGTATILDNDGSGGQPVISLAAADAVESIGAGFGGIVEFTVTLSKAAADTVTVNYRSRAGSADEAIDYPGFNGTLDFAPGETSKTVEVRVRHDSISETDESFGIELFDPGGGVFTGSSKVLRADAFILDDDGVNLDRALMVSSPVIAEGNGGARTALFEVQISEPSVNRLVYEYKTRDGSAAAGDDYVAQGGKLRFAPGQTKAVVEVELTGDRTVEPSEFFSLVVEPASSLGSTVKGLVGTAVILDDDGGGKRPVLSVSATDAVESIGAGFGGTVVFTLTLSKPSSQAVTVDYNSAAGSATEGVDYPAFADTLIFAPGETSKTVGVRVRHDSEIESDESFGIELSGLEGAVFAGGSRVLHSDAFILDDDGVNLGRSIQVTATEAEEPSQGGRFAVFEVTLSDPFSSTEKIRYTTKDNKAKAGQDYVETKGALTFAPGQTKAAVNVELLPDYRAEGTEAFSLVLKQGSFPAGLNVASSITAAKARILDDDIRGTGRKDDIDGTGGPEGIYGRGGSDKLNGRGGADWLDGGTGNDTLTGGSGGDTLLGKSGNDRLHGGKGGDSLTGGKGADDLTGGKGADVFVFYSGDSGTGPNKRDTVTDFSRKQGDKADLSEIDGDRDASGVQDLMWIGRDAEFSGAGEVRFDTARSLLEINLDGDPAAEMRIDFDGLDVFGARDLIF
ncbi:Calx-beta domain-containing protein [Leisingera sp. M523]|uniref:Calx-beta domain-containing protein n=1 Tax=Leisingera sp. M523 TaxID=2867013 RepID=UPI0021A3E95E|nr:Calx-beta domain-containing protein [Leisingera sp. M523]UWQ30621.1 hypothetical protein K3557_08885 [Leisingera sp. M523]